MKRFSKVIKSFLSIVLFLGLCYYPSVCFAGEIDLLVQELMEEGVLSPAKAQQILTLTKENLRKDLARGKVETIPAWIQKISLKGDLRVRGQWEEEEHQNYSRIRERIRFRLGGEAEVTQGLLVGFGLCTGGTDPRSTNQTMEDTFSTKGINLDYAYLQYTPSASSSYLIGKFPNKNLIWIPSDLLWDGDITLEGLGVKKSTKINSADLFINAGAMVLDEVKISGFDPVMYVIQPGISTKVGGNASLKLAASYYAFDNVKGYALDNAAGTNSRIGGMLTYNYDSIGVGAELKVKEIFLPMVALFGEYISNPDPSEDNQGYLAGLKFGADKVESFGQWQLKYQYRRLETDAWIDAFPDSDAYGGNTGIQGSEVILEYGLAKNATFGIDYYKTDLIDNSGKTQDLLQLDVVVKF